MKLLTLILFIFSVQAHADIATVKGQVYAKSNLEACMNDYQSVVRNIHSVEGYSVLSGGCISYGEKNIQMEFSYIYPLASAIDVATQTYTDQDACAASLLQTKNEVAASGNTFVTAYCKGNQMIAQLIDTTYSVIKSINGLAKFDSLDGCHQFLSKMNQSLLRLKMFPLMSTCQTYSHYFAGATFYYPHVQYIAYFERTLGLIKGKKVNVGDSCPSNRSAVEDAFYKNNISLVDMYCTSAVDDTDQMQEMILYLKPVDSVYLEEFKGQELSSLEQCHSQVSSASRIMNGSGLSVLYSFCKENKQRFSPVIHYVRRLEI